MNCVIYDIKDFKVTFNHKFFLDSNIWIYLILPSYSNTESAAIQAYSSFLSEILGRNCLIETNLLQISEVINVILQRELRDYNRLNQEQLNIKSFREKNEFNIAKQNAKKFVDQIIRQATVRNGNLTPKDIDELTSNIELSDFNDLCFVKHCAIENAIFVTHDFDFNALNYPITLLSANRKYLK